MIVVPTLFTSCFSLINFYRSRWVEYLKSTKESIFEFSSDVGMKTVDMVTGASHIFFLVGNSKKW